MAKFKKFIDAQDGKPVFVNPDQVKMVYQYSDSEEACVLFEGKIALSSGYRVSVNAKVSDIVEYLEGKTEKLKYFSDDTEQALAEENDTQQLYKVLINCKNANAVDCAVKIMVKHGIVENNSNARMEVMRDILGPLMEDVNSWFIVKEDMSCTEALELRNDFTNTTCINAKVEEM